LELDGKKKFIEGRMEVDLGSLFVGSDLNLNWWSCGDCGSRSQLILGDLHGMWKIFHQVNLRVFLLLVKFGRSLFHQFSTDGYGVESSSRGRHALLNKKM
jgi:hypothetical protein